jgi:hypothetical protein
MAQPMDKSEAEKVRFVLSHPSARCAEELGIHGALLGGECAARSAVWKVKDAKK